MSSDLLQRVESTGDFWRGEHSPLPQRTSSTLSFPPFSATPNPALFVPPFSVTLNPDSSSLVSELLGRGFPQDQIAAAFRANGGDRDFALRWLQERPELCVIGNSSEIGNQSYTEEGNVSALEALGFGRAGAEVALQRTTSFEKAASWLLDHPEHANETPSIVVPAVACDVSNGKDVETHDLEPAVPFMCKLCQTRCPGEITGALRCANCELCEKCCADSVVRHCPSRVNGGPIHAHPLRYGPSYGICSVGVGSGCMRQCLWSCGVCSFGVCASCIRHDPPEGFMRSGQECRRPRQHFYSAVPIAMPFDRDMALSLAQQDWEQDAPAYQASGIVGLGMLSGNAQPDFPEFPTFPPVPIHLASTAPPVLKRMLSGESKDVLSKLEAKGTAATDLTTVEDLLVRGAAIKDSDPQKHTAFRSAIDAGEIEVAAQLLIGSTITKSEPQDRLANNGEETQNLCAVCRMDIERDTVAGTHGTAVACLNGHTIHATCAADLILGGGVCPTCRSPLHLAQMPEVIETEPVADDSIDGYDEQSTFVPGDYVVIHPSISECKMLNSLPGFGGWQDDMAVLCSQGAEIVDAVDWTAPQSPVPFPGRIRRPLRRRRRRGNIIQRAARNVKKRVNETADNISKIPAQLAEMPTTKMLMGLPGIFAQRIGLANNTTVDTDCVEQQADDSDGEPIHPFDVRISDGSVWRFHPGLLKLTTRISERQLAAKKCAAHLAKLRKELAMVKTEREKIHSQSEEVIKSAGPQLDQMLQRDAAKAIADLADHVSPVDVYRARHLLALAAQWGDDRSARDARDLLYNAVVAGEIDSVARAVRHRNAALSAERALWADAVKKTSTYQVAPEVQVALFTRPRRDAPHTGFVLIPYSTFESSKETVDKEGNLWLRVGSIGDIKEESGYNKAIEKADILRKVKESVHMSKELDSKMMPMETWRKLVPGESRVRIVAGFQEMALLCHQSGAMWGGDVFHMNGNVYTVIENVPPNKYIVYDPVCDEKGYQDGCICVVYKGLALPVDDQMVLAQSYFGQIRDNATYFCNILRAEEIREGVIEIDFDVHGDGSLGPLQDHMASCLGCTPPSSFKCRVEDKNRNIDGTLIYENLIVPASGRLPFRFGTGGYSTVDVPIASGKVSTKAADTESFTVSRNPVAEKPLEVFVAATQQAAPVPALPTILNPVPPRISLPPPILYPVPPTPILYPVPPDVFNPAPYVTIPGASMSAAGYFSMQQGWVQVRPGGPGAPSIVAPVKSSLCCCACEGNLVSPFHRHAPLTKGGSPFARFAAVEPDHVEPGDIVLVAATLRKVVVVRKLVTPIIPAKSETTSRTTDVNPILPGPPPLVSTLSYTAAIAPTTDVNPILPGPPSLIPTPPVTYTSPFADPYPSIAPTTDVNPILPGPPPLVSTLSYTTSIAPTTDVNPILPGPPPLIPTPPVTYTRPFAEPVPSIAPTTDVIPILPAPPPLISTPPYPPPPFPIAPFAQIPYPYGAPEPCNLSSQHKVQPMIICRFPSELGQEDTEESEEDSDENSFLFLAKDLVWPGVPIRGPASSARGLEVEEFRQHLHAPRSRRELVLMCKGDEVAARKIWGESKLSSLLSDSDSVATFASCVRGHLLHARCFQGRLIAGLGCPKCAEPFFVPQVQRLDVDPDSCGHANEHGAEADTRAHELEANLREEASRQEETSASQTLLTVDDSRYNHRQLRMCPVCYSGPMANDACSDLHMHHGQCQTCMSYRASDAEIAAALAKTNGDVVDRIPTCPTCHVRVAFNGCTVCGHLLSGTSWDALPVWDEHAKAKMDIEQRHRRAAQLLAVQVRQEAALLAHEKAALEELRGFGGS